MNRVIIVWAIASMLIVVASVTGKTAEVTSLISQGAGLDGAAVEAASESVLWSFGATSDDGQNPQAPLLADKKGNLYGTTLGGGTNCLPYGCGTVFELSPPNGKQTYWTERVLWIFGTTRGDGEQPWSDLIADKDGNLYGTTNQGGIGLGTVFELSPPTGKQTHWSESVLWNFGATGDDGQNPYDGLLADSQGNLYGTTSTGGANGGGTVFELSPPSGKQTQWSESVLWSFGATADDGVFPYAGLIADKHGNLYGTIVNGGANGLGTAFELSPPTGKQTHWTESLLWTFGATGDDGQTPFAGLIADQQGNLYGTTDGGGANGWGTAFELSPPNGNHTPWSERVLWSFGANSDDGLDPFAGLLADKRGNLYGTTASGGANGLGTAFELSPPTSNHTPWTKKVLWNFGVGDDGSTPLAGLIFERGNFYSTTAAGGANGLGTAFELTLP